MTTRSVGPLLRGGLVLFAMSLPATAWAASPINGGCSPNTLKYSASALDSASTAADFVNIPQASVGFKQGGTKASCVIVRFAALSYGGDGVNSITVRALVDDATPAIPAEIWYGSYEQHAAGVRSFDFIFPSIAPGNHVVRMQFKSEGGGTVYINQHNTIVHFSP